MTDLLSKERLIELTDDKALVLPASHANVASMARELLQRREAAEKPFIVTDDMALSFHHALTDGAIGDDDLHDIKVGLRAALSGLTQQPLTSDEREELQRYRAAKGPVGYTSKANIENVTGRYLELFSKEPSVYRDPVALFTAPPLPVVPDAMRESLYKIANHIAGAKGGLPTEWQDWAEEIETDIRRAAMLQSGNYQVIPEGWALAPLNANMAMIKAGAAAAREHMKKTGGNSPAVIYSAMLAAAPQHKDGTA